MRPYYISDYNIHIYYSYKYTQDEFRTSLVHLRYMYPDNTVLCNRSDASLMREWAAHSFLWKIGLYRDRTAHVDLNYPQKWYIKLGYFVLGNLALLLIK